MSKMAKFNMFYMLIKEKRIRKPVYYIMSHMYIIHSGRYLKGTDRALMNHH